MDNTVNVAGWIEHFSLGRYGLHNQANDDCESPVAASAGDHFNPYGKRYGPLDGTRRHPGEQGNVGADTAGRAEADQVIEDVTLTLIGTNSVSGDSIVVHASAEEPSDPVGNFGASITCGAIEQIEHDMMRM
jgi:Cu-Zn family superoxide dismutase